MKSLSSRFVLSFLLVLMSAVPALSAEAVKPAILIVAFGTSVEKARVSYANIEKEVRTAFPGHELRWAWSAHSLLQSGPDGKAALSPQEALARLATEGVKDVGLLSLHVIPGAEYSNIVRYAGAFEGLPKGLERIRLSRPLLYDTDSMAAAAGALLASLPKERKPGEAVLFVGHGTHHPAGVYYPALQYYLSSLDSKAFVGTVEGDLNIETVAGNLKAASVKKVWLAPLMTVAGDHAVNELFGDEADSWKEQLKARGFVVESIVRGLGEYPACAQLWVKGLREVMKDDAR